MKLNATSLFFSVGLLSLLPVNRAHANFTSNPGDLLTAFYQVNAEGTGVEGETYVYNIGPASGWRENTAVSTLVDNIGADLTAAFGAGWSDNPQIRWGIMGVVGGPDPLTSGDPARTTYYGRPLTTFAPGTSDALTLSSSQRGSVVTAMSTFRNNMTGKTSAANPKGAIVNSADPTSYAQWQVPAKPTSFNIAANPNVPLGPGNLGVSGDYTVEAALDVQRVLHSAAGADLTAGLAQGDAVVGAGQYIGTFTLDAAGNLRLDARVIVTPPAGYDSWATAKGLTVENKAADIDADGDGIDNGVEFVIGGEPLAAGDQAKLPEIAAGAGFVDFIFRRTDDSAASNPGVETTADPGGVWTPAVNGAGGVAITIDNDFFGAGVDRVSVRLPAAGARNFARLTVAIP